MSGDFDRVAELFERALAEPHGQREAWLAAHCADDTTLRTEVASLLARSDDADSFFDTLAEDVRAIDPTQLDETRPPGERIGPYEIEDVIGRGGMGVVYRARDTRLGRLVAIKLLPSWLAHDDAARERLIAEARAASALDHPNIGVLHDVTEAADGVVALVLAHYEGETLRARLDRGALEPAHALDIARQVADGLAAAHARGIVHRDIKPGNLLLGTDGRVRILDFGVADVLGSADAPAPRAGTVAYMSPEQVRGEAAAPASDLWSLGVVLHEMLTGARPFRSHDEADTMRAVLEDAPPPLQPPAAARVVERLLRRDPTQRHADAASLVAALDQAMAALEPRSAPRRRRVRGVALAGAALVVLLAVAFWQETESNAATESANALSDDRLAVLPFVVRGPADVAWLGAGIADLLSAGLHGAGGLFTVDPAGMPERDGPLDAAAAARVATGFGAGRFVLGEVIATGARVRIDVALHRSQRPGEPIDRFYVEGALDSVFALVDDVAGRLLVAERRGPAEQLVRVASVTTSSLPALRRYLDGERAMRDGRFGEAADAFAEAAELDSAFALAHYALSVAAGWSYRPGLAQQAAERALAGADRLPVTERRLVEAQAAWPDGDLPRAERLYRAVLAEQPTAIDAWYNLGEMYFHMNALRGRSMDEAREPFERVARLAGYEHYEALVHLADLAARDRRYDDYGALHARLDSAGDRADVYRLQHVLVTGDSATRARAHAELRAAGAPVIRRVAGRLAGFAGHVPEALEVARLLDQPRMPAEWRAIGHLMAGQFEAALGRWSQAARELDEAETLARAPALLYRAHLWSLPFAPDDPAALDALRSRLEAWDPLATPGTGNALLAVHEPHYAALRRYLLGALSSRLGDRESVRAHLAALEATAADRELAARLARDLRASLATDPLAAARILREPGDFAAPHALAAASPFHAATAARLRLAEALFAAGRLEEAAGWYDSFLGPLLDDVVLHAHAHHRLAAIHQALGRPALAARHQRAAALLGAR